MLDELAQLTALGRPPGAEGIFLSLLVAFVLSQALAGLYVWTHEGLGYPRSFVHALVLSSLVTCLVIVAIGDSLARGLGILGALALVRFRTQVRDPRDILFLFACLGAGISSGAGAYTAAVLGTAAFALVSLYLHFSPFASLRPYEGLLRFVAPAGVADDGRLGSLLGRYCTQARLVSLREAAQGEEFEHAYQVRLLDPACQAGFLSELRELEFLSEPSLLLNRSQVEL